MATFKLGGLVEQIASTATAGGTTTLVNSSRQVQVFTGTLSQTIKLPDATTMVNGQKFEIYNTSTTSIVVQYNDASAFATIAPNTSLITKLSSNGTSNGTWVVLSSGSAGSGSGVGRVNYITNSDAESDATGWATYADAAGVAPVDGTGGSPSITFTRNTTTPLKGTADFKFSKGATNRQGDGASFAFTVPKGLQNGRKNEFTMLIDTTAANYVDGDVRLYIYDVTLGSLITPNSVAVPKIKGPFTIEWDSNSSSSSYRAIIHQSSTNATAYDLFFDDVVVGPGSVVQGAVVNTEISDSGIVTPNSGKFGTVLNTTYFWRRVGDCMEVRGQFTAGTIAGGAPYLTLNGYTIDTNRIYNTVARDGVGSHWVLDASGANFGSDNRSGAMFVDPAQLTRIYFSSGVASNVFNAQVAGGSGSAYAFKFTIPILEWKDSGTVNILKQDNLTAWTTYALTIGATTTAPTKGTIVYDKARWRRLGDSMEIRYDYRQSTGGSAGSGVYLFPLPSGYTIDTTKITPSTDKMQATAVGSGNEMADGGTFHTSTIRAYNTTNLAASDEGVSLSGTDNNAFWSSTDNGRLSLTGMTYSFRALVPILEWANTNSSLVGFANVQQGASGLVKSAGQLLGTNTNDSATAGYVGEIIESTNGTTATTYSTGNVNQAFGPITLTPGHWRVDMSVHATADTCTFSPNAPNASIGLSDNNADTTANLGQNGCGIAFADSTSSTAARSGSGHVFQFFNIAAGSTQVIYGKLRLGFATGSASFKYKLSAMRIR